MATNWVGSSGSWSASQNWSNGIPGAAVDANLIRIDGLARTVDYDYVGTPVDLSGVYIDLLASEANAMTLSIADHNLSTAYLRAGIFGRGVINQTGGAVTVLPGLGLSLGAFAQSSGAYFLSGGDLVSNGDEYIGFQGAGEFYHSAGKNRAMANVMLAVEPGSSGRYDIYDGAELDVSSDLRVGVQGSGVFNAYGGALVSSAQGYVGGAKNSQATVNIAGAGSTWINSGALRVGNGDTAVLTITDSARVTSTDGIVSDATGSIGVVGVKGGGSKWENSANLYVAAKGFGFLLVEQGGVATSVDGYIAEQASSGGEATVDGPGSAWTNSGVLRVGHAAGGTLKVLAGGLVSDVQGLVGSLSTGQGEAVVDGLGSRWLHSSTLSVGAQGKGDLEVSAGGRVSNTTGYLGESSGAVGAAIVTGTGSTWTNSGSLYVGLNGQGALSIADGARVDSASAMMGRHSSATGTATISGPGSRWSIDGDLHVGGDPTAGAGGAATLSINSGAELAVDGDISLYSTGSLSLQGGTLSAGQVKFPSGSGAFSWAGGVLHVGDFQNNLAGVLAPGMSAGKTRVVGNYFQGLSGNLDIEIGGAAPATHYDIVEITALATLSGQLSLSLIDGFAPTAQQQFTILTAGSMFGQFANAADGQRLSTLDGRGSFLVDYEVTGLFGPGKVVLRDFLWADPYPGDFDLDRDVDGADFLKWQRGESPLASSASDFALWKTHFGERATSNASGTAVPEASTLALVIFAAFASVGSARRSGVAR